MSQPELLRRLAGSLESAGTFNVIDTEDGDKIDALRVYEVQAGSLDKAYLDEWAERLEVGARWRRVREEADIL